jgi:heme/copper-type cytochrome/quinol oxidase subunit 2
MRRLAPLLAVALLAGAAWACDSCKNAVSQNGASLARGFYWSILVMVATPFTIVGGVGAVLLWLYRRSRAAAD